MSGVEPALSVQTALGAPDTEEASLVLCSPWAEQALEGASSDSREEKLSRNYSGCSVIRRPLVRVAEASGTQIWGRTGLAGACSFSALSLC